MATIKLRLGELLAQRQARENRQITLDEIAEATGVSTDTLTAMVNNETDQVSLQALAELCECLSCAPADLLSLTRDETMDDEAVDVRDIVNKWEQHYGADEHPRQ